MLDDVRAAQVNIFEMFIDDMFSVISRLMKGHYPSHHAAPELEQMTWLIIYGILEQYHQGQVSLDKHS